MQNTTNYNLKKPDYTDFADIQDINDNMDIIDQKLASPDGNARDEVVTFTDDDLDTGITSFGTYLSKIVSGMKLAKFIRDFKAGMQYVLHKGSLINNGTCNTAGEYALDAAYGKVLRDDIDSLNSSLSQKMNNGIFTINNFAKFDVACDYSGVDVSRINITFRFATGTRYVLRINTGSKTLILDFYSFDGTYKRIWQGTLN